MPDHDEPQPLAPIDACLVQIERRLCRLERRSLVRIRQNYGIYAILTLMVATLIIAGRQRLGYASGDLLNILYVADAACCGLVWLLVFLAPLLPAGADDGR